MSVLTTATNPKLLWPGLKDIWGDYFYNRYPEEFSNIFDVSNSTQNYEEYQGETGFGLVPEKAQGGAILMDTVLAGYNKRFTHTAYAMMWAATKEEISDNLYKKVGTARSIGFARSMRLTVETVDANHLNRAFNSSYTGADGKELCATDHPNVNGGTWQNELTNAADLSEASLNDLGVLIMNAKDDRGLQLQLKPQKLIVSNNDYYEALRITKSALQPGTANNDVNTIIASAMFPKGVLAWSFLTDTDAFFIKTDAPFGLMHIWRDMPEYETSNDFNTKNILHSGYMRFSSGWVDPRCIYGVPGI